jgi:hypothetical protein
MGFVNGPLLKIKAAIEKEEIPKTLSSIIFSMISPSESLPAIIERNSKPFLDSLAELAVELEDLVSRF